MGDMAVANVLGSNIFNILVGLGLPWLLQSLVTGQPYPLNPDEPLGLFVAIMMLYLVVFLSVVHLNGWFLSLNLAYAFFAGQFVFVAFVVTAFVTDLGL